MEIVRRWLIKNKALFGRLRLLPRWLIWRFRRTNRLILCNIFPTKFLQQNIFPTNPPPPYTSQLFFSHTQYPLFYSKTRFPDFSHFSHFCQKPIFQHFNTLHNIPSSSHPKRQNLRFESRAPVVGIYL